MRRFFSVDEEFSLYERPWPGPEFTLWLAVLHQSINDVQYFDFRQAAREWIDSGAPRSA